MKRDEILKKAEQIVCGERDRMYGNPQDNFALIAKFWSDYLRAACVEEGADISVGAEDVAMMMILFKVARDATAIWRKEDTFVDICGYAACGGELASGGHGYEGEAEAAYEELKRFRGQMCGAGEDTPAVVVEDGPENIDGISYLDVFLKHNPTFKKELIGKELCRMNWFEGGMHTFGCHQFEGNCNACWNDQWKGERFNG